MLPLLLIAIASLAVLGRYIYVFRQRYLKEHSKTQQYEACIEGLEAQLTRQNQLTEIVEVLETQKGKLKQELADLRANEQHSATVQQDLETAQKELASWQFQLAQTNLEYVALQAACQELATEQANLSQQINTLKTEHQELRSDLQRLRHQKTNLERACDRLSAEQADLEAANQNLEEKHYGLMDQEIKLERLQGLINQNQTLTQQAHQLQTELSQCMQANPQHLKRLQIVSACHRHNNEISELFHVAIDMNFKQVIEALEFAEVLFGDVLEIWESARSAAYSSNFIRPADVYRSLQSFAWFGRDYFRKNGELGTSLYQALKAYNLDYSSESETTQNNPKALERRRFWHRDRNKIMLNHLKLGGGNGIDNILRVYFDLNLDSQKIEIGYCGRHL
jgi:uncharacterized coiled-coil DUF342 family protein